LKRRKHISILRLSPPPVPTMAKFRMEEQYPY
jgi:hypothetical protein